MLDANAIHGRDVPQPMPSSYQLKRYLDSEVDVSTLRVIKKYANRRLYDTESSSYITLEDLKKLVLDRVEFRVVDAQTQADITKSTLLQIISAHEETTAPIFTIEVLQHLIRSYGDNVQNLLGQYLEQAMGFFIQQQEVYKMRQQEYNAHSFDWMNEWLGLQQKFWNSLNNPFTENHSAKQSQTKKTQPPAKRTTGKKII